MLEIKDLEFTYDQENAFKFPDMEFPKGTHWLITGPSGCGKTTLLHLIAGLLRPAKGRIVIDHTDITMLPPAKADQWRGLHIGIVFQKSYFVSSLSAGENIGLAPYFNGLKKSRQEIMDVMDKLNIKDKYPVKPQHLSQGEQQRVSIARAVINNPSIILADEPTSSLDDLHCRDVLMLLLDQAEKHQSSLIVVTHDQRVKSFFSNVIHLDRVRL
ncbi:MAG: ABC transporter ATP-binding protein [Mangrovibacterium sp.]